MYPLKDVLSAENTPESSGHLPKSSGHLPKSSGHLEILKDIANPISSKKKAPKQQVKDVIIALCDGCYLSLNELAALLNRDGEALRKHYLQSMVKDGELELEIKQIPNHPKQRYTAVKK